jgi:ketosteroid isomerase-like protein
MSRENVELVKSIHPNGVDLVALFGAGERSIPPPIAAAADLFAEDFDVRFFALDGRQRQPESQGRGVEELLAAWRDWLEPWESYRLDVEDFIDAGDDVVVLVHIRGRTARDGVEMEHAPAAIFTVRSGKVVRLHFYMDRAQALETAGREELARHEGRN